MATKRTPTKPAPSKRAAASKPAPAKKSSPRPTPSDRVEYVLGKGTPRLLDARVDKEEIRLLVNGPAMLYGSCQLLTSLDAGDGATFHAWNKLAASFTCTSHCGANGKTKIPVVVQTSRIGTCIEFGTGPMSMYLGTVILRTKKKGTTFKQAIDAAFGDPKVRYIAMIVPQPATGHLEHDASIFNPDALPDNAPEPAKPGTAPPEPEPGHMDHHHLPPEGEGGGHKH